MARIASRKTPALLLSLGLIAACTATIAPEWTRLYNHEAATQPDRLAWLEDMAVNSYGDVLVAGTTIRAGLENREHDLLLVRYTDAGQRLWANDFDLATGSERSDDTALAMALDPQDNAYILANQFRVPDANRSSSGAWLISTDSAGNERWRSNVSSTEEMRALTLANDKLYVTGPKTSVYDLAGNLLQSIDHPDHTANALQAQSNGQFVTAGGTVVTFYGANGQRLWQKTTEAGSWGGGSVLFTMNGDIVATHLREENGAARITRYSPEGQQIWTRTFRAAYQSYGLPGPALVFEDYRGDLVLTASNADGNRVVKLDSAGRVIWNKTSRSGIVKDAALKGTDLFVVGGGFNAKYDADGNRIAESRAGRNVQITTGSVAIDGDNLYAGYSAESNGTFALFLSQYKDQ